MEIFSLISANPLANANDVEDFYFLYLLLSKLMEMSLWTNTTFISYALFINQTFILYDIVECDKQVVVV